MKAITLRFSDRTHHLIHEAADMEGLSVSRFLREAALIRAVWVKAANGDYDKLSTEDLYTRARALLDAEDKRRRPKPSDEPQS